jgi:Leucine-rich repeat (LRR) protein
MRLFFAGLILSLLVSVNALAQTGVEVAVSDTEVIPGTQGFTVDITLNDQAPAIRAGEINIGYDSNILTFVSGAQVDGDGFLTDGDGFLIDQYREVEPDETNPQPGQVKIFLATTPYAGPAANTAATLAQLTFNMAEGVSIGTTTSLIILSSSPGLVNYSDGENISVPYTAKDGTVTVVQGGIPSEERQALIDFYNSAGGDNWTDNTNWLGEPGTECTWYGVSCNDANSHVTGLYFYQNNLAGTLPASLGNLTELEHLDLDGWNEANFFSPLTGDIPKELGNLSKLQSLVLSYNRLTGAIPTELGNLTNLTYLRLGSNQLTGSIPPELGNLSNLQTLSLSDNQLTGAIPTELGNLKNLKEFDLGWNNNLTSEGIPEWLENFTGLIHLNLGGTNRIGNIPAWMGNLTNLTSLYLYSNQLSGVIPSELGNLTELSVLDLSYNEFTPGEIPSSLKNLINLGQLNLAGTNRTGEIPNWLGTFTNLWGVSLRENKLTGAIPSELGNLKNLIWLSLSDNQLSGVIPSELGNLTELSELDLGYNEFTPGEIPSWLKNLTNLMYLNLSGTNRTGELPTWLGSLTNLMGLYLEENEVTEGEIPEWLKTLTNLSDLGLSRTNRTGEIPNWLGTLSNLHYLRLSGNDLTGTIPPELGNLSNLHFLHLGENHLTGPLPTELMNLTNLLDYQSDFCNNELYTSDDALREFLNTKDWSGDWESCQRSSNTPPVALNSKLFITEGETGTGTLKAEDADDDPLTYYILTEPEYGSLTLTDPETGAYEYVPGSGYIPEGAIDPCWWPGACEDTTGTDIFTFKVNDGEADSEPAAVKITVEKAPRHTVTLISSPTEGGTIEALGDAVTDDEGNILVKDGENQRVRIIPNEHWKIEEVLINGEAGDLDEQNRYTFQEVTRDYTLTVTFERILYPPTISGEPDIIVYEDTAYSFTPEAEDTDGENLSFDIENQPDWTEFDPETGALTGTPGNEDIGTTEGILITVSDEDEETASLPAFDLTVINTNDAPEISGDPVTSVEENGTYSFTPSATDQDPEDYLSFSIENQPDWANFDTVTGALTGTPGDEHTGTYSGIVISVTDQDGQTASLPAFAIEVVDVYHAPTISGAPATIAQEDAAYSFVPLAEDPDGDPLVFGIINQPDWADFDTATGAITGTPGNEHVGIYEGIVIFASDGGEETASLPAFTLTVENVNDIPVISGEPFTLTEEDTEYTFTPQAEDPDKDDSLSFGIENQPGWANFDPQTGTLAGTPGNEHVGTYPGILITVTDKAGETASLPPFDIQVVNVNDPPEISGEPPVSVKQDEAYSFGPFAYDSDLDPLSFTVTNQPEWMNFDRATGALTGTPGNDDVGTYEGIVITVSDGSQETASLPPFDLTVENVNDLPYFISEDPPASVQEDTEYRFTFIAEDPDKDSLSFSIENCPSWAALDPDTGELTGTPENEHVQIYREIRISVTDGQATVPLEPFDITVWNVNDPPEISGEPPLQVNAYETYAFKPEAADPDIGDQEISFSIENKPDWAEFNEATGELTGIPENKDAGTTEEIIITAADSGGETDSLPPFRITVAEVSNNPPETPAAVSPDDEALVPAEEAVILEASAFSDPDDDEHSSTVWQIERSDGEIFSDTQTAADTEDLTRFTVPAAYLEPGLRYFWKVRYKDSREGLSLWSDSRVFKIGESQSLTWNNGETIPAGQEPKDFKMISFVHWPRNPSPMSVFKSVLDKTAGGAYNTEVLRIAQYDPLIREYRECDDENMIIEPGKAYWFFTLTDAEIESEGIPVSPAHDMEVKLQYGDGWNMVACPADVLYYWDQVEVLQYNDDGTVKSGPVPISSQDNNLADKRLWQWKDGAYVYYHPEGLETEGYEPDPDADAAFMKPGGGYWVKALAENAVLRFTQDAQASSDAEAGMMMKGKSRSETRLSSSRQAADGPPAPLSGFTSPKSSSGGGTACFINSASQTLPAQNSLITVFLLLTIGAVLVAFVGKKRE